MTQDQRRRSAHRRKAYAIVAGSLALLFVGAGIWLARMSAPVPEFERALAESRERWAAVRGTAAPYQPKPREQPPPPANAPEAEQTRWAAVVLEPSEESALARIHPTGMIEAFPLPRGIGVPLAGNLHYKAHKPIPDELRAEMHRFGGWLPPTSRTSPQRIAWDLSGNHRSALIARSVEVRALNALPAALADEADRAALRRMVDLGVSEWLSNEPLVSNG